LLKGLWRGGVERAIATPEVTLTDAVSLAAQDGELEREREKVLLRYLAVGGLRVADDNLVCHE
jgi:hypothetical protein